MARFILSHLILTLNIRVGEGRGGERAQSPFTYEMNDFSFLDLYGYISVLDKTD